ncbi:metallophosphoesterase [Ruania albidiflava]|uniref:metallophosphoesterase n=1 Tax=Ruania albidiflava TaxID=366586 RepID=UPI0003F68241|nr:metallophosphoesterase [Ruania albidiflava]
MSETTTRPLRRATRLLGAAGAAGLAWSLAEAQAFTVRRVEAPVLPAGAASIRLLHLSDLHLLPRQSRKIGWLRDLAALAPDLVVNTGDNMAHREALPAVLAALEPLLEVPGAFVMGSNDYFAPLLRNPARYLLPDARRHDPDERPEDLPGRELGYAFAACGWRDLSNQTASLEVRGTRLDLVGVEDPHLDRDELPETWPAQHQVADGAGSPAEQSAPGSSGAVSSAGSGVRIGVTHAPYLRVLRGMQSLGCELVLAGHTHGGQLCLPGYGALVTNCDLDTGRASGLHPWPGDAPGPGNLWLHVSNGMGTNPYTPVRLACRPSVTLLTLTPPR